jgi:hypothetical protein
MQGDAWAMGGSCWAVTLEQELHSIASSSQVMMTWLTLDHTAAFRQGSDLSVATCCMTSRPQGNINLINAAIKKGVKKFVLVTSLGCGSSQKAVSERVGGVGTWGWGLVGGHR